MITRQQFDEYLHKTLGSAEAAAFLAQDVLHNGLQTFGANTIQRVGFGVSASKELFRLAKQEQCEAIVVHHGINIQSRNLDRLSYERLAELIRSDISLWSAHFLLDSHPTLGNNAQILKTIGAKRQKQYVKNGVPWGWYGAFETPVTVDQAIERLEGKCSPATITYRFGPKEIRTVVVNSGGGAPHSFQMDELMQEKVDLFITGELNEWNREFFREAKINFIAAGHYHTEMFGLLALQQQMESDLHVQTVWLDLPNEV